MGRAGDAVALYAEAGAKEAVEKRDRVPPNDPGKDAVWVILRFGGAEILSHLNALGYQQAGAIRYKSPTHE